MHALIQNDQITHVGPLPSIWWDGDRWHDLRDDDGTQAAALGWLPVTYQPRPDDTATATWDRDEPALVNGLPVVGWTVAAWSASARYEVGDRCTRGGRLYECLVAHGAEYAGTWGPPQASVWTDLGPA